MLYALLLAATAQSAPISLTVDARDITRGLYHVSERLAAPSGKLTLVYPKWLPGGHSPGGPINSIIDFRILADGKRIEWTRDLVDMYRVDANVPTGARQIEIDFTQADDSGSAHLDRLKWIDLVWYPPRPSDEVSVQAHLILPDDWSIATALPIKSHTGSEVDFEPASLTRVVDSPAEIGRYYRQYDVTGSSSVKHYLDVMADTEVGVEVPQAVVDKVRRIHEEMEAITGTHHYRDYHWLLTLSDNGAGAGLEHHESSEDGTEADAIKGNQIDLADLLCHEYFHSYNGKFRRPLGLCTPDYQAPMKDDLLWVYEGLTQFMGHLLATRAGWWTPEQWREQMALNYVEMNTHRGREWRPLEDTAAGIPAAFTGFRGGQTWQSARRTQDYYVEMTIVWLEVDMKIRELTDGQRSLLDFERLFHGGPANGPELKSYTFDDVVTALNRVAPYDWGSLLRERVYRLQPDLSTKGFELAGWRLVYNDLPNSMMGMIYGSRGGLMLSTSIGLFIAADGTIQDVVPGYAGDKAGLAPGMKVLSVDGSKYGEGGLTQATKMGGTINLTVAYKEAVRSAAIVYSGGLRIPHLERISGTPDRLVDLLRPLSK